MQSGLARSASELRKVLGRTQQGFEVAQVPAAEAPDWAVVDGALQHRSGGFFSVNGVSRGSEQCILLYQPQAAVTGVITTLVDGERWFLLQARAEPGCLGEVQFGPTVQSTPANYMRLHGGTETPHVGSFIVFDPKVAVVDDTTQLDLGERYLFKSKRSILVEASEPDPPQSAFVWATPQAIYEAVHRSAFLNIDLRSILAIAHWSAEPDSGDLSPISEEVRRSLVAPIRADLVGEVVKRLRSADSEVSRFVPLGSLDNWRQTEWGWAEREHRQGFSIDFFDVKAAYREVQRWVQPLVNSASEGHAVLACRDNRGILEFLVRPGTERGLATTSALAPSYLRYPGEEGDPPDWLAAPDAKVWSSTTESDEGGRFYRDASLYQVVRVDDTAGPEVDAGVWLRLSELKVMLRTSNVCTIQLRGLASQLLGVV